MPNKSEHKDLNSLLDELKLELLSYINKRIKLFKLDAFEKGGISIATIGYGLIVAIIIGTILFFSLFGLAFFLGELLDSPAAGFGILALFALFVLLLVIMNGKRLRSFILNKAIVFMQKLDRNETE